MGLASVGATEEEVREMRATILDLIARGRLQILVETGWQPGPELNRRNEDLQLATGVPYLSQIGAVASNCKGLKQQYNPVGPHSGSTYVSRS